MIVVRGLGVYAPGFAKKEVSGVLCTQISSSYPQMVLNGMEGSEFEESGERVD